MFAGGFPQVVGKMKGEMARPLLWAAFIALVVFSSYLFGGVVLCGMFEGSDWCARIPHFSLVELEGLIREAGALGVAASMGLMVLHSFVPLPGEFIAVANGMVYGMFWGTVITWTGAMLGAVLSFGLARRLGRDYVRRSMRGHRRLRSMEQWIEGHGGEAVFVSRFIPVISFNLINYAAGLTGIGWWTFIWATGLGILPITSMMVVMGSKMLTMPWWGWALFVAAGLALWAMGHVLSARLRGGGRGAH